MVILDGVSQSSIEAELSPFWQALLEEITGSGIRGVLMCLTCECSDEMDDLSAVPSAVFLRLGPLEMSGCEEAVTRALVAANRVCDTPVSVTDKALALLGKLSGGYPHHLQCLAHSAFEQDSDGLITSEDVEGGGYREGGGLALIGSLYYGDARPLNRMSRDRRAILAALASRPDEDFSLRTLQQLRKREPDEIADSLTNLTSRGIVTASVGEEVRYRISGRAAAAYIMCQVSRERQVRSHMADDAVPLLFGALLVMLGLVLLYQGALIPVPLALACVTMGFALITGSKRAHRALKINHRAAQRL